jgi:AraC-like DNA-binding protein
MQTDMSVINVALACGFASPSHSVLTRTETTLIANVEAAHVPRARRFDRKTARVVGTILSERVLDGLQCSPSSWSPDHTRRDYRNGVGRSLTRLMQAMTHPHYVCTINTT